MRLVNKTADAKLVNESIDTQSMGSFMLPNFIEIQSDEEDNEIMQKMSKANGGRVKQYKKEKSLGILC